MRPIFVTGIGTDVGKTIVAAIITEALQANYWKPVQAGISGGTDSEWVRTMLTNPESRIIPETYRLEMAASPHIAARSAEKNIQLGAISEYFSINIPSNNLLVIEGAGGLMVPLNEREFVHDLIRLLNARVIIVSRNYLGSINHSLLTATVCRAYQLDVLGWIFNDQYLDYENEIARWSGYPAIASIPRANEVNKDFILQQAARIKPALNQLV
ncbi:MAG TPA: dethiobiotin synthase [Chitinophagaceae bacterium]